MAYTITYTNTPGKGLLLLFLFIGIIIFGLSLYLFKSTYDFTNEALVANGEIAEFKQITQSGTEHKITYAPMIKYTTIDNKEITFASQTSSTQSIFFSSYNIGDKVEVLYLKNNPYKAEISTFTRIWIGPIIALFVSLMFIFASTYNLLKTK